MHSHGETTGFRKVTTWRGSGPELIFANGNILDIKYGNSFLVLFCLLTACLVASSESSTTGISAFLERTNYCFDTDEY